MWKNRFYGTLEFYKKVTNDLLLTFEVPQPSEVPTILANVGEVENKGIELELNGIIVSTSNLEWSLSGNITHNVSNVVSLSNDTWKTVAIFHENLSIAGQSGNCKIITPGEPLNSFYGYEFIGYENGQEKFTDINGDGQITPGEDQKIIGNSSPDFFYGLGTNARYKRFDLGINFIGVAGQEVVNGTALDIQGISKLPGYNTTKEALNEGLDYGDISQFSSKWVQKASYCRLDYVRLAYNFDLSNVSWIKNASLYVTGQNLFVITKYAGYDPEVRNGVDITNYPRPRSFQLGVKFSF
jgi:outer membrane receptor protein involved in Fe transport